MIPFDYKRICPDKISRYICVYDMHYRQKRTLQDKVNSTHAGFIVSGDGTHAYGEHLTAVYSSFLVPYIRKNINTHLSTVADMNDPRYAYMVQNI